MLAARLFRSELSLVFGRGRNIAGLVALAVVPIIIAVAVKVTDTDSGPNFIGAITGNGMFVALAALTAALPLFLPVGIAAIAGDSIAGEASLGTLRYLLTVPVSRNRLLMHKFGAIAVFCAATTALIAVVGIAVGWLLFPAGEVTLLSGDRISQVDGLARLALICGYIALSLAALGALGLFISTLTEQPVGAMLITLAITVVAEIVGAIDQLDVLHPFLFVHYWTYYGDILRSPIAWDNVRDGVLVALVHIAIFGSAAWARFSTKDISS